MDKTAPPETREEDPPHDYDTKRYEKVVKFINEHRHRHRQYRGIGATEATRLHDLRRMMADEASSDGQGLNLMNDSMLHLVIGRRNTELAVEIIDIINIRVPKERDLLRHQNYYGDTPLHIAAAKGDSRVAEALLKKDPDKELARERNRKGETALHKAVLYGHLDVFNIIIHMAGEGVAKDRTGDGSTILHYAIMSNHPKEAFAIAYRFPDMIPTRNAAGATPLQIMVAFLKKPSEAGIFESFLYKHLTLVKAISFCMKKAGITHQESERIENASAGNWRSRLADRLRKCQLLQNIEKLRIKLVKAVEEKLKYETTLKLLRFLALPAKDDTQSFTFYFKGFKTNDRLNSPKMAPDTGDGDSHKPESLAEGNTTKVDVSSSNTTNTAADVACSAADGKGKTVLPYSTRIWEESPLITGVKLGLDDFVIKILKVCPQSATYVGYDGMNVLQAAVKYDRRQVVKAIEQDKRLPSWLMTELQSDTMNTLLHIAATDKKIHKEADPLRLQDELEGFEMLEKIVPEELWNYRNKAEKTARELFDEMHEEMLTNCRTELADIGKTCSPLVAAVVFTSSFYIPSEDNRDINQLAFKIFSHVYVVGFSCSATSLVMFLLLLVTPFKQRDFRRVVPWHYLMAFFLLAMSLAAFIVAFTCNMYLQIYRRQKKSHVELATLLLELLLVPFLCALALIVAGASWRFGSVVGRLTK